MYPPGTDNTLPLDPTALTEHLHIEELGYTTKQRSLNRVRRTGSTLTGLLLVLSTVNVFAGIAVP